MYLRLLNVLGLAVLGLLVAASTVRAAPPPPFSPDGTVKINEENVPDGTVVSAWCGGVQYKSTTTQTYASESWYFNLDIPGDDPDTVDKDGCSPNETVDFKIGGLWADQTAPWTSSSPQIDLTATDIDHRTVTLTIEPTTQTVGNTVSLTATVKDQFGNPVADGTVVTFTATAGIPGLQTATTVNGIAAAVLTLPTTPQIVSVTGTLDGVSDTKPITVIPGLPATLGLEASPTTIVVPGSTTVTATAKDQYNNLVADGTVVIFNTSLGSVSPVTNTTISGVTATTLTCGSSEVGTAVVTGMADSIVGTGTVPCQQGGAGPILSITGYTIDDDIYDDSYGNSDGVANPGEFLEIHLSLANTGSATASNVVIYPTTTSPYVNPYGAYFYNDSLDFGDVPPGATVEGEDFDFVLSSAAADGTIISFDLEITDGTDTWIDSFDLIVTGTDTIPPNIGGWGVFPSQYVPVGTPGDIVAFIREGGTLTAVTADIESPDENVVATITLYDDGNHNDGPANDRWFGGSYTPTNQLDYYIDLAATDDNGNLGTEPNITGFTSTPFIKTTDILLVLDTWVDGSGLRPYFTHALVAGGYGYDLWETFFRGWDIGSELNQYIKSSVIWAAPNPGAGNLLDSKVQTALQSFLNGGGHLFITGQDVGWALTGDGSVNNTLYNDYLHAAYVQDDVNLYGLNGGPGDPIGNGLSMSITGGDGANNQIWPSEVDPIAPAATIFTYNPTSTQPSQLLGVPIPGRDPGQNFFTKRAKKHKFLTVPGHPTLKWPSVQRRASEEIPVSVEPRGVISSGSGAIRVDTGTYKVVYFAFGFEAIADATARQQVMDRVLNWLGSLPGGLGPTLSIPGKIPARAGQSVSVPVTFTGNSNSIASTIFSIDFDQTCLGFDPTDGNGDGIPDAVTFNVPPAFTTSVTFDANDTDGELDFLISDITPPLTALADGVMVTITFTAVCQPDPAASIIVSAGFSSDPTASYGNTEGQSVPGTTSGGSVEIFSSNTPGDANGDTAVDAGDISALVLEIFDGDGNQAGDTPGGTFPGDPVGCDANQDNLVDAGDISCTVLLIFNGPGGCGVVGLAHESNQLDPIDTAVAITGPALTIPDHLPASPGNSVTVPVEFRANNNDISSLIFSVDYDQNRLSFDPTDGNSDGLPDAVTFNVSAAFNVSVTFDGGDTDGELDFFIADLVPPLVSLPDGTIFSITLNVNNTASPTKAAVNFSQNPPASFGNTLGQSIPGTTDDGSVLIICPDFAGPSWVDITDIMAITSHLGDQSRNPGWDDVKQFDLNMDYDIDVDDVKAGAAVWRNTCS